MKDYPKASNTVDIICTRFKGGKEVLLIERRGEPFKGSFAIPGGYINIDETLEQSALRELKEETHLVPDWIRQFKTYGNPKRDPRGRVISTVFYTSEFPENVEPVADDDAKSFKWVALNALPNLAFDHNQILEEFRKFLGLNP